MKIKISTVNNMCMFQLPGDLGRIITLLNQPSMIIKKSVKISTNVYPTYFLVLKNLGTKKCTFR